MSTDLQMIPYKINKRKYKLVFTGFTDPFVCLIYTRTKFR